jgi:hypothetical protein
VAVKKAAVGSVLVKEDLPLISFPFLPLPLPSCRSNTPTNPPEENHATLF